MAVQKVFSDLGEPKGYILGEEVAGANVGYLHYGKNIPDPVLGVRRPSSISKIGKGRIPTNRGRPCGAARSCG